ncbi:uncharacterized protein C622.15c-like isoform X2 [Pieris rapae]|uniref:uncharacterized protein C622.15c-like isoform X2 n=1 Tax=Pieris rapae TaxID=64459 RepID=UPI001E280BA4|nr:uncharacterized protein C622.15c-like isoform X2 [Pieris rapae]
MEGKALILTLVFAVANSRVYYGKDRPDSIFGTLPHMLHDMIKGHRNVLGNNYNQQPDTNNFNSDPYGSRLNSGYQNYMGNQESGHSGYNIPNHQGLPHSELNEPSEGLRADNMEEIKREVPGKHNSNASEIPNRFNDTPQILYAVNIAPSDTNQWNRNPSAPLTNAITQTPSLTNTQTFIQTPNQAPYATLITPNQTPLINKVAEPNPFGNSIVLPNANGGSSVYTIVNLPNTIANADIPSQMFQSTDVISNPSNYQVQNSIPTANSGIINGMPTYYVVSVPNQSPQTIQTSVPYTNAPVRYSVGYISSNGQTVLVPSSPTVYQIIPQTFVPISQSNVQSAYVPVSSGQPNVIAQPLTNQGNTAVTYVPVSNSVTTGQQTYMTVPNSQGNVPNSQINYVPVTNGQGNMASQPNYVTVSNGQGNTGTQINVVPSAQENTQINYVPVSSGQENSGSQPNYVTVTSGQGNTGSQLNLVPVTNSQGNTQNYVPVSSDQSNVVTLTSAPSETMVLPADTQSVTLLSFKDKDEEKPKKKPSKKKSKKK